MAVRRIRNCGESRKNWICSRILEPILFPSLLGNRMFGDVGGDGTFNRGVWFKNPQRLPHHFGF